MYRQPIFDQIGFQAGITAGGSSAMLADQSIRILLIDEQTMIREGLRAIIEKQLGMAVVGETGDREEAIDLTQREQPNIILLDASLGCDSNWAMVPRLLVIANAARVLILTATRDPQAHRQAIIFGARGVVSKQESSEVLIKAIKRVLAGEIWLERSVTTSLLFEVLSGAQEADSESAKIAVLTRRERQVVSLAAEGLKNKQIADRLFIAESTVSHHLTSIFGKLGISDRLQLIIYAHRLGLMKLMP